MKSARVLKLLHISRATLVKYVKNKEIIVVINDSEDKSDENSRRRKRKLELIKEDLKNEISL